MIASPPVNSIWNDTANALVVDTTSVYVAGRRFGVIPGSPGAVHFWRIERRSRLDGTLTAGFGANGVADYAINPTSGEPLAMKADGPDLLLAGYDLGWRMQRVDASGSSVWIATSVTGNGPGVNRAHGLVIDGSSIYVAGFDGVNNNVGWRIEKRDKSNGTLDNGFGSNGVVTRQLSAGNDTATGIASDPTGLLVSGWRGGPSGNHGWWIEKIDPTTGNTLTCFGTAGVVTHDPTTSSDEAYGIVTDGTGAYVYGRDMTPGNGAWRVYKLNTIGLQGFNVVAGGNVGIGTRNPQRILTVQQNSTTDPVADGWTIYSSRRWKSDITPLAGALDQVLQLQGVHYRWNATGQRDIGLIAEDVGAVVPEVVSFEENGKDAVGLDYARLIPLLIEAIKAQQTQIDELRAQLQNRDDRR